MGLADRHYMRTNPASSIRRIPPVAAWFVILILNVIVFVAQNSGGVNVDREFLNTAR
jgi:hypothetical protein